MIVKMNRNVAVLGLFIAIILGLGNSGLHPVQSSSGYTGAPGDSNCGASCHTGGNPNLDGNITISGLPPTIQGGQTYTITVTLTNPNGNAVRGGFQLLALTGTNTNAGSMSNPSANTQIRTAGTKNYFGHAPSINFPASNELVYTVDWQAPTSAGSNPIIKFFASGVIGNGANGNDNDRVVLTNIQVPIEGSQALSVSINNVQAATCNDGSNGQAQANASGGGGSYNYLWNNGVTTSLNTSLPPGMAVVTVTDNLGATASSSVNITSPPFLALSATGSTVCSGSSNGFANANASGGVPSYNFLWSNGQSGTSINGLSAGTYTVTVTDSNGCTKSSSATVTTSPAVNISGNVTNVSCNGLNNGSISLNVSGGSGFTYLWSNGSTVSSISNLAPNTYTVTVTNQNSCSSTASFNITQPTVLDATVSNVNNVTCFGGNNGSATVTASGGSPSYNYQWSNGSSGSGASNTQSNLTAGAYTVTVTDILDCQKIVNFSISQGQQTIISLGSQTNPPCFGQSNGVISINASGQSGGFGYLWSNGATTPQISNLAAGTYTVSVTNSVNCTATASYNITTPTVLQASFNVTNVTCNGLNNGIVTVSPTGGFGIYSYLWINEATTATISNQTPGTKTVTVTDGNGCTASFSATVSEPAPLQTTVVNLVNASCTGATNGSITLATTNGIAPYTYVWSNGSNANPLTNVTSGTYTVTVTDANVCSKIENFTLGSNASFTLTQGPVTNNTCFGGNAGVANVIQSPNLTYLWSTGASGTTISNLTAGNYTVTGTDQNNCQSTPLVVNISQPPLIQSTLVASDTIVCPSDTTGFLTVALSGGTGSLSYVWSNGDTGLNLDSLLSGTYSISITDQNNCLRSYEYKVILADTIRIDSVNISDVSCFGENDGSISLLTSGGYKNRQFLWSNMSTNDTIVNLVQDTFYLSIRDDANCVLQDSFIVNQPDSLFAAVTVVDESAAGEGNGSITVTPVGGTSPYSILWNNNETTFMIDSLSPGLYSYELNDANACGFSSFVVVGGGNCSLSVGFAIDSSSCFNTFDGSINLSITGGTPTYEVQLFSGNERLFYPLDSLAAGEYTVIVIDAEDCISAIQNVDVPSRYAAIVLDSLNITNPSTLNSTDGSAEVFVSGGEGSLTYEWFLDNQLVGTSNSISNARAGTYEVHILDDAGCDLEINEIILNATNSTYDVLEDNIQIYPSPATDFLVLDNSKLYEIQSFELYNTNGQRVYSSEISEIAPSYTFNVYDLNLSHTGMFVARLKANGFFVYKKIQVLK